MVSKNSRIIPRTVEPYGTVYSPLGPAAVVLVKLIGVNKGRRVTFEIL